MSNVTVIIAKISADGNRQRRVARAVAALGAPQGAALAVRGGDVPPRERPDELIASASLA